MDYPDPEEEFELLHAEELEALKELEGPTAVPVPASRPSKRQLDFSSEPVQAVTTASDLFGDISDLEGEPMVEQPKRQKIECAEERQEELIRTIVEQRRLKSQGSGPAMEESFRRRAAGGVAVGPVPKWPFIPMSVRGERVYVRLHSEETVAGQSQRVKGEQSVGHLLETPYKELHSLAVLETARKIERRNAAAKKNVVVGSSSSKDLWVEKYRPTGYLQLLSDEATNRALLHWLKLWDKLVFNREPKVQQPGLLDDQHRPVQRVALLCGPPGLGKTTLAHMIAQQAGYCPIEVNASDDRSPQSFKTHIEAATQMKSVLGADPRPNCLILDEIDGAPSAAVDLLVKYVARNKPEGKKKKNNDLRRPIICICNDVYVPALRALRQVAFTLTFPPTTAVRLGERLVEISKKEKISTDLGTMMVLSEKTNNDIRSSLSVLQYLKSNNSKVTLSQVQASSVGSKDMQRGLFDVWNSVFHVKLSRGNKSSCGSSGEVLRTVQSYGDYDRLTSGVFENYVQVRLDVSLGPVVEALSWFVTNDVVSTHIQSTQTYALYSFLPWTFVKWHSLFATIQRPKLRYPSAHYDATSHLTRTQQILNFALSGMAPMLQVHTNRSKLLLDVAPMLIDLITPNVRPVSAQLFSSKERSELARVVNAMADYNVTYTQTRSSEGSYTFQLDPNIEQLATFGAEGREAVTNYTVRQLLSKEVETERIRRAAAKATPAVASTPLPEGKKSEVPNHLQTLTPKAVKKKPDLVQAKDFFGRVVQRSLADVKSKAKTDEIVKSDIWFHFKEGYNNAVRKNVYISDLL